MIKEYDLVLLTHDIDEYGLKAGDAGAVLIVYDGGKAFEVEFVTDKGDTIALLTLDAEEVRPKQAE
jgi:hypothetical protein